MNYIDYINSGRWRNSPARLAELKAAGFRCRICHDDGGGSALEVHHRTYVRLGNERPDDLTALCSPCHRIVTEHLRRRKFAQRPPAYANIRGPLENPSPLFDPTFKEEI